MPYGSTKFVMCAAYAFAIAAGTCLFAASETRAEWSLGAPIVMYWNAGGATTLNRTIAEQAVAGGYNLVWVNQPSQLAIAEQYGLRAMVFDPYNYLLNPASLDDADRLAKLDRYIDGFKSSPAMYCYYVADEPGAAQFADLARLVDHLRKRDPEHLAYIDVQGIYGQTFGTRDFAAYLAQYVATVHPQLLCDDIYPFVPGADAGLWLQNLAMVGHAAKQAKIPFMNVVQACAWDDNYRLPSANELRFENYTALAYGAQGVCYFNYATPRPNTGGLVNADGTPTSTYAALVPLNHEFVAIATQLQPLNHLGTYVKGYRAEALPPGTTALPAEAPFQVRDHGDEISFTKPPLKGLLLGLFGKTGTTPIDATAALVVNLDYAAAKKCTLAGPGKLATFDATANTWTAADSDAIQLTLPPGSGTLVRLASAHAQD